MSVNNESQCYFIQLQIDSYLDGELSMTQRDLFMSHVHACTGCAAELHYARTVQDTLMDLPPVDCDDRVLVPMYRLTRRLVGPGWPAGWRRWYQNLNPSLRYALPVAVLVLAAVALWPLVDEPQPATPALAENQLAPAEYSPEEVAAALRDLNLAIEYLNEVSERTEVMIGERFLIAPLRESLNASFEEAFDGDEPALNNGPI